MKKDFNVINFALDITKRKSFLHAKKMTKNNHKLRIFIFSLTRSFLVRKFNYYHYFEAMFSR